MAAIKISERAKKDIDKILSYLHENWPQYVNDELLDKFDYLLLQIEKMPHSFPNVRLQSKIYKRAKLTKHNAVYFRIYLKTITIVTVHDIRQKKVNIQKK